MPACRQCLFQQVKSDCLKIDPKWRTFPDHHECFLVPLVLEYCI